MSLLLEARQLSRYYANYCAVDEVSFALRKGQVLGFLGPNGAGKTTTMQMLSGNLAPSSGQVFINHYDLLQQPKLAKAGLGYLPDTPPLYKELTTVEYLSYCARLHGLQGAAITKAVDKALEQCGLTEVGERLLGNLSKGYQQRAGIAQAILHDPPVIILDEPTVGLDPIQIREIRSLIRELGEAHGVILSTHILSEVQESCTDVQIIHKGKLVLHETVAGLNRQMQTGTLLVSTTVPASLEALSAIPGVTSVEVAGKNQLKIHHTLAEDVRDRIAETIINAGWGLQEMAPVKRSIEDIFVSLTKSQNTPDL